MNTSHNDYLKTALEAADIARTVTSRYFRTRIPIDNKSDLSPVTTADRETENAVRAHIESRHPDHGIYGEEGGNRITDQQFRWIIDPIDGTKSFATGRPTFGTLIALMEEDLPVLGLIDQSILNERWVGVRNSRTTFNGQACRTRNEHRPDHCTIYASSPDMFDQPSSERFRNLSERCRFGVWGGDCYCYGLLASGHTDIVCESDMFPYDFLSLVPVVEGAGGMISDWEGNPLTLDSGGNVLATANSRLHDVALSLLNP